MALSDKQKIYVEMMARALIYIRNAQTRSFVSRAFDKSVLNEAQFVHNLGVCVLEDDFTDADVWFFNVHAKRYFLQDDVYQTNLEAHREDVGKLISLMPPNIREKLSWRGP